MFHTSVINKGKDNVFGWNNQGRMYFFITDTICQSSALSLPRETKKLIKNGILRIFLFSFGKRRGR